MTPFVRRSTLVVTAIGLATFLLHVQLARALVIRGDALDYVGQTDAARTMYARALFFDPRSVVAADRYALSALLSHRRGTLVQGVAVATRFLGIDPDDAAIRFDRALCFQRLGDVRAAAVDFARVGKQTRDARALMFAALDERRIGEFKRSRRDIAQAVADEPAFVPARRMLAARAHVGN